MTDVAGTKGTRARWGDQIRQARVARRLSQAEVGAAIGIEGPTVSRAESGRGSLDTFLKLAAHLGITLEAGDAS